MKRTKVKSAPPMKACESTSFRMYLVRMRTDSSLPLVYRAGFFGGKALQAKAVSENANGAESHRGSGDGGVEKKSSEGVEDTGGDRDAEQVVAESPAKVLAHDAEGLAGEAESGDDLGGV